MLSSRAGGRSGDIVPVNLAAIHPSASDFGVIGWTSTENGGAALDLEVTENALRGDHHLEVGGQTVAHVLFSDRVANYGAGSGRDFNASGQLYLAPPTDGLTGNSEYCGQLQLWYRLGGSRVDGT